MKNILLDTNVILDFALNRQDFYVAAKIILGAAYSGKIAAFISASSVTDIFYIVKKNRDRKLALEFLKDLTTFVGVANVNKDIILDALESDLIDFEDAVQDCTAVKNDIEIILTRNEKDFKGSRCNIVNPDDFVSKYLFDIK